jgi:hypothetical protein
LTEIYHQLSRKAMSAEAETKKVPQGQKIAIGPGAAQEEKKGCC